MAYCGCCSGGSTDGCHLGWSESFARDRERWGRKTTAAATANKTADQQAKITKREKELQKAEDDLKNKPGDPDLMKKVDECKEKLKKAQGKSKGSEATSNAAQTGLYLFTRMILGKLDSSPGYAPRLTSKSAYRDRYGSCETAPDAAWS